MLTVFLSERESSRRFSIFNLMGRWILDTVDKEKSENVYLLNYQCKAGVGGGVVTGVAAHGVGIFNDPFLPGEGIFESFFAWHTLGSIERFKILQDQSYCKLYFQNQKVHQVEIVHEMFNFQEAFSLDFEFSWPCFRSFGRKFSWSVIKTF